MAKPKSTKGGGARSIRVAAVRFIPGKGDVGPRVVTGQKRKPGKGGTSGKRPASKKKGPAKPPVVKPGGFAFTPTTSRTGHPKMQIVAEGGIAFEVPYAPRDVTRTGIAPTFDSVERGGRTPLLLRSGDNLQTLEYDLMLGYPDPRTSIATELAALSAIAESGKRVLVSLDAATSKSRWRITGYSEQTTDRQHLTNAPTRAKVSMTLTEASDPVVAVGPVSGGHSAGKDGGKKGEGDKKRPRTCVVKKGDTLQKISKRFYGDASHWDEIAKANKIRNVKAQLKVGMKLTLPKDDAKGGDGFEVYTPKTKSKGK